MSGVKKAFLTYNIALLGFLFYLASLPLVAPILGRFLPSLYICSYASKLGKSCICCGITRDLGQMFGGNNDTLINPLSKYIVVYLFFSFLLRSIALIVNSKLSDTSIRLFMYIDILIHGIGLIFVCIMVS